MSTRMSTRMKRTTCLAALLVAAGLSLSACGSSNGSSASTGSTATTTPSSPASSPSAPASSPSSGSQASTAAMLTIKDYKFTAPASVPAGATITVKNEDSVAHTVTADDSSAGFDVKVDANATATFKAPSKPGSYAYHCDYHSNMHGTLKVG